AMVSRDMVGRLRTDRLLALGAATAREFPALLDSLNGAVAGAHFDLRASGDGWGPSDHASFFAAKRPVVHLFTDLHEDYHRATDDWDKINASGLARVAEFAAELAWTLANRVGDLAFVDAPPHAAAVGGQGYGAYLGTIPDMSESLGGVRITGVRAGSPAERAGLQAGDVITTIGDKTVANLYDMTDALRSHQPGDTVVDVAVIRNYLACNLETKSELVVLIRRGETTLGQLDIDSDVPAGFSEAHHTAVKQVADALAVLL